MPNELTLFEVASSLSDIDLNKAVEDAQSVGRLFEKIGIKEATLHNGDYFNHNLDKNTKVVVTEGCIIEEKTHTITITLKKVSADSLAAVSEVDGKTQKALGSFVGKTQPWISEKKE